MFRLASNQEIGAYIASLIDKRYHSGAAFCKKWLKIENVRIDEQELQNKRNRLSQIKNGNKSIQIADLPAFSELLQVSCEELLSAGASFAEEKGRLTNYNVALSQDPAVWEAYAQGAERAFLSADEYDKTVIDYALEYRNYPFLQYLMNTGHLQFVNRTEEIYGRTFGVSTDIERKPPHRIQDMQYRIMEEDRYRRQVISLAIANEDFEALSNLKAREIPPLYKCGYFPTFMFDRKEYLDPDLLKQIAQSDDKTLAYFSEAFDVPDIHEKGTNTFLFPFIGELAEMLIRTEHDYCDVMLQRILNHNQKIYDRIEALSRDNIEKVTPQLFFYPNPEEKAVEDTFRNFYTNQDQSLISFYADTVQTGLFSNIVRLNAESRSCRIRRLIRDINDLHQRITERACICHS